MKNNVGVADKIVRLALGLVLAATGLYFESWWRLLAIVPLITGLVSYCPLYTIFDLNTSSTKSVQ
jgi:Protein of unknown function (DUF2892)